LQKALTLVKVRVLQEYENPEPDLTLPTLTVPCPSLYKTNTLTIMTGFQINIESVIT
jgi:hypothetical protein